MKDNEQSSKRAKATKVAVHDVSRMNHDHGVEGVTAGHNRSHHMRHPTVEAWQNKMGNDQQQATQTSTTNPPDTAHHHAIHSWRDKFAVLARRAGPAGEMLLSSSASSSHPTGATTVPSSMRAWRQKFPGHRHAQQQQQQEEEEAVTAPGAICIVPGTNNNNNASATLIPSPLDGEAGSITDPRQAPQPAGQEQDGETTIIQADLVDENALLAQAIQQVTAGARQQLLSEAIRAQAVVMQDEDDDASNHNETSSVEVNPQMNPKWTKTRLLTFMTVTFVLILAVVVVAVTVATREGGGEGGQSDGEENTQDRADAPQPSSGVPAVIPTFHPATTTVSPTNAPTQLIPAPVGIPVNDWFQVGTDLTGSNSNDQMGNPVALAANGLFVVAASPGSQSVQSFQFDLANRRWERFGIPLNDGQGDNDAFGTTIGLSGNAQTLVVGAPGADNDVAIGTGSVHVYRHDARTRDWDRPAFVTAGDGNIIYGDAAGALLGYGLSLSANGLTMVSPRRQSGFAGSFSWLYVYTYNSFINTSGQWLLSRERGAYFAHTGLVTALSADGDTVVVGSPNEGLVRCYASNATSEWDQRGQELLGTEADRFGHAVAMSADGNTIAVGAPQWTPEEGSPAETGRVQIYKFNESSSEWVLTGTLQGDSASDGFGTAISVSADGTVVAVGAPQTSVTVGDASGYVKIYEYREEEDVLPGSEGWTWSQIGQTVMGKTTDEEFGTSSMSRRMA